MSNPMESSDYMTPEGQQPWHFMFLFLKQIPYTILDDLQDLENFLKTGMVSSLSSFIPNTWLKATDPHRGPCRGGASAQDTERGVGSSPAEQFPVPSLLWSRASSLTS